MAGCGCCYRRQSLQFLRSLQCALVRGTAPVIRKRTEPYLRIRRRADRDVMQRDDIQPGNPTHLRSGHHSPPPYQPCIAMVCHNTGHRRGTSLSWRSSSTLYHRGSTTQSLLLARAKCGVGCDDRTLGEYWSPVAQDEDSILIPVCHQMLPVGGNNSSAAKKAIWLSCNPSFPLGSFVGPVDSGQLDSCWLPLPCRWQWPVSSLVVNQFASFK